jgi:hypothetical protein
MTKEELRVLEVLIRLDDGDWASSFLDDVESMGRDRFCCHTSNGGGGIHSVESSDRLFRFSDMNRYLIPCRNHLKVYKKSPLFKEVSF